MRRRREGRRAASALEFAIVAPVFVLMLVAIVGEGLCGFFQLTLDDAVRDAARQLQIGESASTSGSGFATAICAELSRIASNCTGRVSYYVQANTPPASFMALQPVTMPANGILGNAFPALASGSNVLIQVAYPLPMYVPLIGKAMTLTGTKTIMATTTVRMEPRN